MLDAKILTAVLASLTVIAAGMNGGSLSLSDVQTAGTDLDMSSNPLDVINNIIDRRPEAENNVSATLKLKALEGKKFEIREGTLSASNLDSVSTGSKKFVSNSEIQLQGIKGSLTFIDREVKLEGYTNKIVSKNVSLEGRSRISQTLNLTEISVENTDRSKFEMAIEQGTIVTPSSRTVIGQEKGRVKIDSFSGDYTVYPENDTIKLEGKVSRITSGSFSFGN